MYKLIEINSRNYNNCLLRLIKTLLKEVIRTSTPVPPLKSMGGTVTFHLSYFYSVKSPKD